MASSADTCICVGSVPGGRWIANTQGFPGQYLQLFVCVALLGSDAWGVEDDVWSLCLPIFVVFEHFQQSVACWWPELVIAEVVRSSGLDSLLRLILELQTSDVEGTEDVSSSVHFV